ncbi:MAG: radical SAM family heme chaperone HemW [Chloroflexota bacterium]|nr:radical SAM family heme chaperone HemW [Chloroflexota bacterium]
MSGGLSLYIHIPFCRSKCRYCGFNSYSGLDSLIPRYVRAVTAEVHRWPGNYPVTTIYLGGGTPTLLSVDQVRDILGACGCFFAVDGAAEVTIEANPGTVTKPYLREIRELGVNRLSLGVQSFNDRELTWLGRSHSAEDAFAAYGLARDVFDNVSIDLLYAMPGQARDDWHVTLKRALVLQPDHVSLYPLSVEEGTPLSDDVLSGRSAPPDPDVAADMYLLAQEELGSYEHYEISNWATPGKKCRHNITYWRNEPYLGFGAGAHSSFAGRRFWNVRSPGDYVQLVSESASPVEHEEHVDRPLEMAETMILGLRLTEGVSLARFAGRFGHDAIEVYRNTIDELAELGLLVTDGDSIRLTGKGRLLGNQAFLRFLP